MSDDPTTYPFVDAIYTPAVVPEYAGNPLIEALPPLPPDEAALDGICWQPDFRAQERSLPTGIRIARLLELRNLMIPLERHPWVIHSLDAMVRSAYTSRAPNSPERARTAQELYEMRQRGQTFRQREAPNSTALSGALFGIPGTGKTTLVRRWSELLPKAIYHPRYNIYQVPVLQADAPSDGTSLRGFCYSLLHQLDARIPGGDYYHEYGVRGKPSADTMLANIVMLANTHSLGMLVIDEAQNFNNANKGDQVVMTEIVSAFNMLRASILFMGTNKAYDIFKTDFRGARRAIAVALPHWDRLAFTHTPGEPDEWAEVVLKLWEFQWIRSPSVLDEWMLKVLYECTQGVMAVLVALFAAAQMKAMLDQTERLTPELIQSVYTSQFKPIHPMMSALRDNDTAKLESYQDITPLNKTLDKIWKLGGSVGMGGEAHGEVPSSGSFAPSLPEVDAIPAPKPRKARIPSRVPNAPTRQRKTPSNAGSQRRDLDPKDYRNAIYAAEAGDSSVYDELLRLALAPSTEEFLSLL